MSCGPPPRSEWDTFRFSKLDYQTVRRLIGIGDRLGRHKTGRAMALENAAHLVRSEPVAPLEHAHNADRAYVV